MLAVREVIGPHQSESFHSRVAEAAALIGMIIRKCGFPPRGARIDARHRDLAVVLEYDTSDPGAVEYVERVFSTPLSQWDWEAECFLRRLR